MTSVTYNSRNQKKLIYNEKIKKDLFLVDDVEFE